MVSPSHTGRRPAAVAGRVYPADPRDLRSRLDQFLTDVPPESREPAGVVVPHAGLVYSGQCAAHVFARIRLGDVVVVLCPTHTGRGDPGRASLWPDGVFETDFSSVERNAAVRIRSLCTVFQVTFDGTTDRA